MMKASLEMEEPTPVEMVSIAAHSEDYNIEATLETTTALEDQYGDRNRAIGSRRQLKKGIQDDHGSWKKMATTHRRMTRHVVPAPVKGHGHQGPVKDGVVSGTPKRQTFENRRQA
jgi:hypothetical protein